MLSPSDAAWCPKTAIQQERSRNFPEDRRERFLTTDELERLGAAIRRRNGWHCVAQ
jgi:hypothetical protein